MQAMDPVLGLIVQFGLGLLFVTAGWRKLRDPGLFRASLREYELVPAPAIGPFAAGLAVLELIAGLAVVVPAWRVPAVAVMSGLLAVYATAMGINLARGRRDIDCGCSGPARRQTLSVWLVARNAVLALAGAISLAAAAHRALIWLDWMTVGSGIAACALLYAAVDLLLVNAPNLRVRHGPSAADL